jgi:hypothetical protein
MSVSLNGTNGLTFNDASTQNTSAFYGGLAFRNRIINGAMVVNQRGYTTASPLNVGAGGFTYITDRFSAYVNATSKMTFGQSTVAPSGFINSLNTTTTTAYSVTAGDLFMLNQPIEGLNVSDLAWGTASAATVTLSFRVYSSLTGTFGGSILNSAVNRSYPFTYSVPTANTWTTIAITIPGDTSGTWLTTNGVGMNVSFGLGMGSTYSGTAGAWAGTQYWSATGAVSVVGTSGATFYITGVQLEKGSTATSFDYRPYGTELMLCQRYYQTGGLAFSGYNTTSGSVGGLAPFAVTMRASPTVVFTDTLNTNTAAGTSQSNIGSTVYAAGGETTVSATGGFRFFRTFTANIEL